MSKIKFRIFFRRRRRAAPNKAEYHQHKEEARSLVWARLVYWSRFAEQIEDPRPERSGRSLSIEFGQVRIKNHKNAWGSCSSKKNLNFNWRLLNLSPELADYVIVHELCHTVHLNHSPQFWELVGRLLPEHRSLRARLRLNSVCQVRLV